MDCSPPGSSVYRILQARILRLDAIPSSRHGSLLQRIDLELDSKYILWEHSGDGDSSTSIPFWRLRYKKYLKKKITGILFLEWDLSAGNMSEYGAATWYKRWMSRHCVLSEGSRELRARQVASWKKWTWGFRTSDSLTKGGNLYFDAKITYLPIIIP